MIICKNADQIYRSVGDDSYIEQVFINLTFVIYENMHIKNLNKRDCTEDCLVLQATLNLNYQKSFMQAHFHNPLEYRSLSDKLCNTHIFIISNLQIVS